MATAPDNVLVKFVLYEKERNIDVQRESDQFDDIIFVQGGTTTDYRSIVYKTFAFVQVRAGCCQYNAATFKKTQLYALLSRYQRSYNGNSRYLFNCLLWFQHAPTVLMVVNCVEGAPLS